jgi:hypothetical protein
VVLDHSNISKGKKGGGYLKKSSQKGQTLNQIATIE